MRTEGNSFDTIRAALVIIALGFLVILLRLWQLQLLQGGDFRKTSESNRLRIIRVPAPRGIIFDRNGIPLVKNTPYFCASVIPEEFDERMIQRLAALLNMQPEEIAEKLKRRHSRPFSPIRLREGLSFEEVGYLEARRSDFPGLIIEIEASREYLYGSAGAHMVGYLGKLTPGQAKDPEFRDVPPDAFIGQWGVEKLYDRSLRGIPGDRVIEVDAIGREIRLLHETQPVKGTDITLSIDLALQEAAAKAFEGKAGALVALAPGSGEILGLVSAPAFDPNKFVKGISAEDWNAIAADKKLPMLNRAIQSQYPPGSTFKIITAIAALEEEAMSETTKVDCNGGISFGRWSFGCWRRTGHNIVAVHRALVESCDVYFYEAGKRLGFDKVADYAMRFGLGEETGITLGKEKKGLIPTSEWKRKTKKAPWFLGETFINSIGQGYVTTTPVQMAVMMSAVANGGKIFTPSLLMGEPPTLRKTVDLKPETLEIVRNSLSGVVQEPSGTGWLARSNMITIGGKTGTAQVVGIRKDSKHLPEHFRDHAWFVAFAPVEHPEIALTVFVEHGGHGGSAAAPIAKKAIEAYVLPLEKKKEFLNAQD